MSRFLKGLSSLMTGQASRSPDRDTQAGAAERDAGPSTLTTPLFPLTGREADGPVVPQRPAALSPRKSASSRALNAVVRSTTQVALSTHVEPSPSSKVVRVRHHSTVVLTETEKLRLQIMQVEIKLTGLGLYEGAIDGMMNRELVDAVRHFQTLKGMRDSGLLTTGTLTALGIRAID
jgi:hypothetical protein